ncbi:phosphoserine aminotransferase [Breznakia sp. PF5-3]|uniref:3-phosphoserine/phosphohydroxythreonine transaminase n=1 Tax=unclassified Breznakia TaxID=2623764 RepID=UPI002404B406|nr:MULTISPECIES: 3-phosphoserine/phosphohydroxythreonine transaminase [unclassified Breznakia]MDF9823724.1 phosphoserine aminotransferase [Breznakia sp. PM6-1]MDF9834522.1 phosphoserine aminotransferase [Breznakia sp. PF5-3]MDF9837507.1 phosphoserine aminotransferase [Breznakia sp. PFB2-8]MDF9859084.1 phosphoserine aminotransferase [Breznakia sp. PH5-24]
MNRVYNFSAGPSQMNEKVLEKAASELLNYHGTGQSVMEMSHRSKEFLEVFESCRSRLIKLMNIPSNYKVLFLQGGASLQFSMIPMNLLSNHKKAAVINTGAWSKKAIKELNKLGEAVVIASSEEDTFSYIPKEYDVPKDVDYFYICENNTIYGTKFHTLPDTKDIPLVADQSSCILSEPIDVSKYGIIFAGAQKNLGMAGLTLVIVREDLIKENDELPSMLSYKVQADNDSMFNTPPTYAIYMLGLVLEWIEEEFGSLENLQKTNQKKASMIYDFLDASSMFTGTVAKEDRSYMNIPFVSTSKELDEKFIAEAKAAGMVNLKGHRSVGGMRASIYNAMNVEGVEKLVAFMKEFEARNK